jgi:predicted amidohydrolase
MGNKVPGREVRGMAKSLRVGSVQFEHLAGDKAANLAKVTDFARRAAAEKVELLLFPECCITGYWHLRRLSRPELEELAEPVPEGPSAQVLSRLSAELQMIIGAGLLEKGEGNALYNTFVVAMPDGGVYAHRKIHAFISEHVSSGSEYTLFDTGRGWRAGVLICYDNNIVENVRITALKGAEILLAPHQTGGCNLTDPHSMGLVDRNKWDNRRNDPRAIEEELRGPKGRGWLMRWLPSRAHDNGVFLIFSNGVGVDDDEIRTGNAMILDPYGRVLAETSKAGDDMVVADLDGSLMETCTGRRWVRARRPELYRPLTIPTGQEKDTRILRFE